MAVVIRMKRLGRKNRPFFRICATDSRSPRDGKVIEELGTYDPMVGETDARVVLNEPRVEYWLGVGAKPSEAVGVLIKKYRTGGTHHEQMLAARAKLSAPKEIPPPPAPAVSPRKKKQAEAEAADDAAADAGAAAAENLAESAG